MKNLRFDNANSRCFPYDDPPPDLLPDYCPHCGAKMDGDNDDP